MLLKWGMKLFIGGGVFMNEEITKTVVSMHHMIAHIDSKIEVITKRFGVTLRQYFVLEALHNNGELAVNELQEEILDSNAAISLVIKNLEKHKLISRRLDDEDRRKNLLSLTDFGRDVIERAYPKVLEMYEEELQVYSPEEIQTLKKLIAKYEQA